MTSQYRPKSWVDPRLEVRRSPIDRKGMFARACIGEGEVIVIWGGTLFTQEDIDQGKVAERSYTAIDENQFLGNPACLGNYADTFMNHACDPNVWMYDEVTLVTRRAIETGEELTADYAMWYETPGEIAPWTCQCGSPDCRGQVTGDDWELPELQKRYAGHFSPFLNRRIAKKQEQKAR